MVSSTKQMQISVCIKHFTLQKKLQKKTMWAEPVPYIQIHYYILIHLFTLIRMWWNSETLSLYRIKILGVKWVFSRNQESHT